MIFWRFVSDFLFYAANNPTRSHQDKGNNEKSSHQQQDQTDHHHHHQSSSGNQVRESARQGAQEGIETRARTYFGSTYLQPTNSTY